MSGLKPIELASVALALTLLVGCQTQLVSDAGVELLTAEEAAELSLTEAELDTVLAQPPIRLRDTNPGPRIVLVYPQVDDDEGRIVHSESPTDLRVRFEERLAPVDMNTLVVKARKGMLTKSITDRLLPFVKGTAIDARNLKLPKGRYRIVVSVADADGTRTVEEYRLIVDEP